MLTKMLKKSSELPFLHRSPVRWFENGFVKPASVKSSGAVSPIAKLNNREIQRYCHLEPADIHLLSAAKDWQA
jgi:hypothetical protein